MGGAILRRDDHEHHDQSREDHHDAPVGAAPVRSMEQAQETEELRPDAASLVCRRVASRRPALWARCTLGARTALRPARRGPVVYLADHPVTGGYPVVATLCVADADRVAQVRPGQDIRFVLISRSPP
jgi:Carboxyltransferase domain, subdomain A and B